MIILNHAQSTNQISKKIENILNLLHQEEIQQKRYTSLFSLFPFQVMIVAKHGS